jgi:predicted Ser/Thr protein kinase
MISRKFEWYSQESFRFLGKGYTSTAYVNQKRTVVIKHVVRYISNTVFEREIHWLKVLNAKGFNWAPKFISSKFPFLVMEYAGTPLNAHNCPSNWSQQCDTIVKQMREVNMRHNDIKKGDIMVKGGRLYLLDYQWASLGNDYSCGGKFNRSKKPHGLFNNLKGVVKQMIK